MTGRSIGTYQLKELLGAGGMGEVYRAVDRKLGRDVAVKILPQQFTDDAERLARFEREARLLAAVNHPNIGAIYGLEEADGLRALVLELVEGQTLAERIARDGPTSGVSPKEALQIASQIVDALDAAHERAIVHRDLKPSNIKITPSSVVKLLDFGLAKTFAADALTATGGRTAEGVVLGTAAYMSPEQARGLPVDKRTDIWAFGCVLYEMLTGHAAFAADTVSDTIAAVLEHDPDWRALPVAAPPPLRQLLRRCLEKDLRRRLRDIGDARYQLEEAQHALDSEPARRSRGSSTRDVEFQRITDFKGQKESPAVSPDGKMATFVAVVNGRRQLWIRFLAGGSALQVTRDEVDHEHPRWAPDSSTIIYYTPASVRGEEGTIWEISALGGPPRRVASAIGGGDISRDGLRIALFQSAEGQVALSTVARDGSRAKCVALLPAGFTYASPRWAPDDGAIAFQRASNTAWDACLETVSITGAERQLVVRNDWLKGFSWRPDGAGLVYSSSRGSTLRYPPTFNLRTVERDGRGDRQLTFGDHSYVDPDAYSPGKLLAGRITSHSEIWRFPVEGSPAENVRDASPLTSQTAQVQTPSPSPDGTEVVYLSDSGGHANLWVARTDGSGARQITFERDPDIGIGAPKWSPTGHVIVLIMSRGGQTDLWTVHPDGGGLRQIVERAWGPCWSGDGRWLYYHSLVTGAERIEKVPVDGGGRTLVRSEVGSRQPAISIDGTSLYYEMPLGLTKFGYWAADHEFWVARPEDGPAERLACISAARVPISSGMLHMALSPDDRWLAVPLIDGATTNIWALPTTGGPMTPITDFGHRSIIIARSVAWSADGRSVYAAVAETETDVVLFDGLI